jgi:hypothetical protein
MTALLLSSGCGDVAFSFGKHPDVTWWTDHETGDLSEWKESTPPGGFILPGNSSSVEVVKGIARSGTHSLLITDKSPGARDFPLAARNGPLPAEMYSSAWYYMPAALKPKSYWWFVLFRSRHSPYDSGSFRDEIAVSFTTRADGNVGTVVHRRSAGSSPTSTELDESVLPVVDLPVPVGQWFHIEVFHRTGTDDSGHLTVWQDGELTFDVNGTNSQTNWAEWMTGGVVDGLTTDASQLYIDDAAISTRRLGPLPPFSRE